MIKTYPKLPFDSLPTPTPRGIKLLFVLTFTFYWFCLNHSSAVDLNIAQDAYGLGMGGAVAAIAAGTQAVPYNPAGIARANLPSVQGGMGFWPGPSNFDLSLGGLYPLNDGTVFGFDGITPDKVISGAPKDGLINLAAAFIAMKMRQ